VLQEEDTVICYIEHMSIFTLIFTLHCANNNWLYVYSVQSLSHIVQVLDPDGNGSINFVQFSEGVKRILELQGSGILISIWF